MYVLFFFFLGLTIFIVIVSYGMKPDEFKKLVFNLAPYLCFAAF